MLRRTLPAALWTSALLLMFVAASVVLWPRAYADTPERATPSDRSQEEIDLVPVNWDSLLRQGVRITPSPLGPTIPREGCGYVIQVPNRQVGDDLRDHLLAEQREAMTYLVWQRTYYGAKEGWRGIPMEDRGSPFQNHEDHLHLHRC